MKLRQLRKEQDDQNNSVMTLGIQIMTKKQNKYLKEKIIPQLQKNKNISLKEIP